MNLKVTLSLISSLLCEKNGEYNGKTNSQQLAHNQFLNSIVFVFWIKFIHYQIEKLLYKAKTNPGKCLVEFNDKDSSQYSDLSSHNKN